MATAKTKKLACGGVGPCCHIDYAHRHCEHCDVVISLVTFTWPWPGLPATVRPYQPYWGTYNNTAQGNTTGVAHVLEASWKDTAALPSQTAQHLCEVKS